MDVSIGIGSAYYNGEDWDQLVDYTIAADRMGVAQAWSAEAWGMDAIVPLAYLAAKTQNIQLGTGILQISARVPSMIAMTAQSMDTVSKGRFILGLGVSGPQVVEGLHGAAFAKPLSRLRECVEILRIALAGEKLAYEGKHYVLPRPGGEGKAIRLSQPPRPNLPIYLATLAPGLTFEHYGTDGGDLITAARTLGVPHPTGYPTYTLLAWLFSHLPVGIIAYRVNLLSAISAAGAVSSRGSSA